MPSPRLQACAQPLCVRFDVALLDLDGVVYVGREAVPGASQALAAARKHGMRLAFVTNNAARPPRAVADHLSSLGIPAETGDVITSAQAAAHYLAERLRVGARVLVVGTTGLREALQERGLTPVDSAEDDPAAVVQGYSPDLDWKQLAEGAVAIRRGLPWVATNLDPTVPSLRGPLPGNGSLVAALRHATGAEPVSTGKPDPTMHRETVLRSGARRPIVVGDRLDTDIEGANAVGCAGLLVLTGVTTAADLLRAPARLRPQFLARDVAGLLEPAAEVVVRDGVAVAGRWRAVLDGAGVRLEGRRSDRFAPDSPASREGGDNDEAGDDGDQPDTEGDQHDADVDALRALAVAAWTFTDADTSPATKREVPPITVTDHAAEQTLLRLELSPSK